MQYETGDSSAIAVTGSGNAVEVHVGINNRLFYRVEAGLTFANQVMYLNRDQQAGSGRVMVVDYSSGQAPLPGQQLYLEKWGDSPLLDGWEDDNDWHLEASFILR